MVIMENYFNPAHLADLIRKIDMMHLMYLEMEEAPEKLDYRAKLESVIEEFLMTVDSRHKFTLPETEEVFYKSARQKKGFSAYKAAIGWNALQSYAGNLMAQPWRKEYRQIKMYSGYYKHCIEANLLGAEKLFQAMGYRYNGDGVLILDGPVCPDQVADLSRDCLIAYVECQIMKNLYEKSSQTNISWIDIIELRRRYSGATEQNTYTNYHDERMPEVDLYQPTSPVTQMIVPNNYNCMPSPTHSRYLTPIQQAPHCCQPGYGPYGVYPMMVPKGYCCRNYIPVQQPIPTAQLIQIDSRSEYDSVDGATGWKNRSRTNSVALEPEVVQNGEVLKNGIDTLMDDKHSSNKDWDYVYRDLEKQGYSKDLGERGDVLSSTLNDRTKRHSKEPKKIKITNLSEAMNNMLVEDRPLKITEALEKFEQKSIEKPVNQRERRHSHGSFYDNVGSNETKVSVAKQQSTKSQIKALPKEKTEKQVPIVPLLENVPVKPKETVPKWQCKTCTFLNDLPKDICKMCSKSWNAGDEKPIEVGGAECTRCTLVNPKSVKICQACGCSLKNSPTYI